MSCTKFQCTRSKTVHFILKFSINFKSWTSYNIKSSALDCIAYDIIAIYPSKQSKRCKTGFYFSWQFEKCFVYTGVQSRTNAKTSQFDKWPFHAMQKQFDLKVIWMIAFICLNHVPLTIKSLWHSWILWNTIKMKLVSRNFFYTWFPFF